MNAAFRSEPILGALARVAARCRWLQAPAGILIVLLQRTPAVTVAAQAEYAIGTYAVEAFKGAFALAALGAYNSVAGATTFGVTPATPATGKAGTSFAISGTAGTALSVAYTVTGAPGNPKSWSVTGTLPTGLSVTGGNPVNVSAPYKMTIAGTPTTAGTWSVTVDAWELASAKGNHASITCNFTITGGVSNVAPTITTQPASATVNVGGSVTFTAAASGTPAPTFQWYHGVTALGGQTAASLSLSNVQAADAGSYTMTATNAAGSATTAAATLTVNSPAVAPAITTQPQSVTVTAGSPASFTVSASGTAPLAYQWAKNGTSLSGATASTFSIASAQATDAANYTVVVTNSAGSATSAAATLTVNAVQTAPSITTQPQAVTAAPGASATFSVTASGTGPLTYQWRKDAVNIAGATSASYQIAAVAAADAGNYSVVVTNGVGSVTSAAAALTVSVAQTAPSITTQPQAVTAAPGASVTFSVAASGTGPLTYQWRKDAVNIAGATSASYQIAAVAAADAGNYSVVVTNGVGSATSAAAALTVSVVQTAPSITTQPQAVTAAPGASATFSVAASGTGPLTYQWRKDAVNIAGATSASYQIAAVAAADAGNYSVVVTNGVGSVTSAAAALTVSVAQTAPSITTQPQAVTAAPGASVTFSVTASGTGPLTYQWRKDAVDIAGATSASYQIAAVAAADAGNYSVVVTNGVGSVTSAAAALTVSVVQTAPSITTQPINATAAVGGSASFTVAASGTGPLSYQWLKDGANLPGATAATLAIANIQASDAGSYSAAVTNAVGSAVSSSATLTATDPPAGLGPVSLTSNTQTVASGHGASLSAMSPGPAGATYQWQVSTDGGVTWSPVANGSTYAGANSSTLTVNDATVAMGGYKYRLTVTANGSSVTSGVVALNVIASPLPGPFGIVVSPAGLLVVSDSSNNTIDTVTAAGEVTVLAGAAGQQGSTDGQGGSALFRQPGGLAVDAAGNVYVADTGNSLIRRIATNGVVTTIAGSASNQGFRDGNGSSAWFNSPTDLAVDAAGNIYVADTGNSVIRRIAPDGTVTTLAGAAGVRGSADGTGSAARFNQPSGITVDQAGNIFVSDTFNQTIRRLTPGGAVTTWAGIQGISGSADGNLSTAMFNQPGGLTVDAAGNLYVADTGNASIRVVSPSGTVATLAGLSTVAGLEDGTGMEGWFNQPKQIKRDASGNLFVTDNGNAALRIVTMGGDVTTMTLSQTATSGGTSGSTGGGTSTPPPSGGSTSSTGSGKAGAGGLDAWWACLVAMIIGLGLDGRRRARDRSA